ncbi:MAG: hypothetical protein Q8R36_03525 [bacterium]|nr:hypothetical protein [bacterium]
MKAKLAAIPKPALFTHRGMEYYLVEFKPARGVKSNTHRDALKALKLGGYVPAKLRNVSIFNRPEFKSLGKQWISLFDCRTDMKDRMAYFMDPGSTKMGKELGIANQDDGLCFYSLDHGVGGGENPALCWRKANK